MTDDPKTPYDKYLEARIAALEAENAKLRRQVEFVKLRLRVKENGSCCVCRSATHLHPDCPHNQAKETT